MHLDAHVMLESFAATRAFLSPGGHLLATSLALRVWILLEYSAALRLERTESDLPIYGGETQSQWRAPQGGGLSRLTRPLRVSRVPAFLRKIYLRGVPQGVLNWV